MIDLEDSVPVANKADGRDVVGHHLDEIDFGSKVVSVRVNDPFTEDGQADLEAVVSGPEIVQSICLPKVVTADSVVRVCHVLEVLERRRGRERPLAVEVLIENVAAMENLADIARAPRVCSLTFGPGDFAVSLGASRSALYAPDPRLPDPFWMARLAVLTAARIGGVQAIDGPSVDLTGTVRLPQEVNAVVNAGFDGKWALHPAQLATINAGFTPSNDDVRWAREITSAASRFAQAGEGALVLDGAFIDEAIVKQAKRILSRVL
jgi:citrate lyase subunit beta/citryl-CoA lyase